MGLTLRSAGFQDGQTIPRRFTCDGEDVSPPLRWSDPPPSTRSLALVVEDPDAPDPAHPQRTWVHWIVFNLPADCPGLPEDADRHGLPAGSRSGRNDWQRAGWGGPCPPIGRHRYFFRLFALDTRLEGLNAPNRTELEQAIAGHILDRAELVGLYGRSS